MSGNHPEAPPPDPEPETPGFPAVGQFDLIPGPGDEGYVPPEEVELVEIEDLEEDNPDDAFDDDDPDAADGEHDNGDEE